MITGYNHNVRYGSLLFHVQTEDAGEKNKVVTTHVFYQGNVVTSRKLSYRHVPDNSEKNDAIRKIMQDQHKAVIKALLGGDFDDLEGMKGILSNVKGEEPPAKSSVYKVLQPNEQKSDKDSEGKDDSSQKQEKSLDEMILDYLDDKKSK